MSRDREELLQQLCQWFEDHNSSLGFAESCTGGLLSSWLAARSGVSKFFQGAVVSYAGEVKESLLEVPAGTIQEFGEVSVEVAQAMAHGACRKLNSDWSVSITGIAGPTGGTEKKPVGTVCFGISGPDFEKSVRMNFGEKQRTLLQEESALYALELLYRCLPHINNKEDI